MQIGPIQVIDPSLSGLSNHQHPGQQTKDSAASENALYHRILQPKESKIEKDHESRSHKIEVLSKSLTNAKEHLNQDIIPSRYDQKTVCDLSYIKTNHSQCIERAKKEPNNCAFRFPVTQSCLLHASIFREAIQSNPNFSNLEPYIKKEKAFLDSAKWENQQAKIIDSFHPLYYSTEAMIMEYEGVDCKNFDRVEKYVRLLLTAKALDPDSAEIKQKLNETLQFLVDRWKQLEEESTIDIKIRSIWSQQLVKMLGEDPLKVLFIENPDLFKLAALPKYASFFEKHPELKSLEALVKKYPDLRIFDCVDEINCINKKALSKILTAFENDPLALELRLISETQLPIVQEDVANEIKNGMLKCFEKQKPLKIYVGNKDDVLMISKSFRNDPSLVTGKGAIKAEVVKMNGYSAPVYIIYINPDNPYVRNS